jgi:hypothetical protein
MYDVFFLVHTNFKNWLKEKFNKILKYEFVIMCMFNTPIYYFYINWILTYNISNDDT